jgi:hypothetical protein
MTNTHERQYVRIVLEYSTARLPLPHKPLSLFLTLSPSSTGEHNPRSLENEDILQHIMSKQTRKAPEYPVYYVRDPKFREE